MSRFTIEFTTEADNDLETLRIALGVPKKTKVIYKALSLLKFVMAEKAKGGILYIENTKDNVRKEIVTI